MITQEELQSTFNPDKLHKSVQALTVAFKEGRLINWDNEVLKNPIPYKGFILTSIPVIDINAVAKYLDLDLSETDYSDMTQYSIRAQYRNKVIRRYIREMLLTNESLQSFVKFAIQILRTPRIVFDVVCGDEDEHDVVRVDIKQVCTINDNDNGLNFMEEPNDELFNQVLKKIPLKEFTSRYPAITSVDGNEELETHLIYKLPNDYLDVMYPIIEEFFNMTVSRRHDNDSLRILAYQHRMLSKAVEQACSNNTILAYMYGSKLMEISNISYSLK